MIDFKGPLSRHFTWTEAITSQEALRRNLDNTPSVEVADAIMFTAQRMDEVRDFLGEQVIVSSWYRSPKVNAAVNGAATSQHMKGEAVDFVCPGFGTTHAIFNAIKDSGILYDQLIIEFPNSRTGGWIHISFSEAPRHVAYYIDENGTKKS